MNFDSTPYEYEYYIEWVKKISENTVIYSNETSGQVSSILDEKNFYYNEINSLPSNIYLYNYNYEGNTQIQQIYYPQDFTDDISRGMVNRHMIETPIETININQGKVVSGEKIEYKYESVADMYVPSIGYVLKITSDVTLTTSNYRNYFVPKLYYDIYNSKGKVQQLRTDMETVVYIWSYKNQYPIAEIKNTTYQQVRDALGGENYISQLSDKLIPNEEDFSKIRNLRTSLPNTQISTYTYKTLIGMDTATDPRGITTYFNYDTSGRLVERYIIENGTKKVLQQYDYHYQNQ